MRRVMLITVAIIGLAVTFFGAWTLLYPSPNDPKNLKYVLWRAGLSDMSLEQATTTMIADPHRDTLVLGKTKAQLRSKFKVLLAPDEASQYLRACYQNSPWETRDVVFVGKSAWMIVFDGDKATNLVLVKGC